MPRGSALGMVSQLPDQDEFSTSRAQIRADIDVCMGGRVAEELVYGADQVTPIEVATVHNYMRLTWTGSQNISMVSGDVTRTDFLGLQTLYFKADRRAVHGHLSHVR